MYLNKLHNTLVDYFLFTLSKSISTTIPIGIFVLNLSGKVAQKFMLP